MSRPVIGYETEFTNTSVLEAVHRQCASLSDRDGVPIRAGSPESGKHRCAHCGERIGRKRARRPCNRARKSA